MVPEQKPHQVLIVAGGDDTTIYIPAF